MRVLVIEDERRIAQAVRQGLEQEAFIVDVCYDGADGLRVASNASADYDIILIGLTRPEIGSVKTCRLLRQNSIYSPILLLTAKDQSQDVVRGLDAGADDYLPKPFSMEILLARIRALVRQPPAIQNDVLQAKGLSLDPSNRKVSRNGRPIALSAKEYGILEYLLRNKGRVVSKNSLMSHVWDFDADILPNNVEVFIAYLRAKIDRPFKGSAIIKTVRGFGYTIEVDDGPAGRGVGSLPLA